jgi:phenylpropionate dioxygenase-like ring-hydroxylating dioxygenase large terminal subunit
MANEAKKAPPSFEEAKNRRNKVRAAGLDPNYWYPVEHDGVLKPGQVQQVKFWGEPPVALFRDEDGRLHAIEDRCAHRHLPLSMGQVQGNKLVCQYHGWAYNGCGELTDVPHDLFGKKMPKCTLRRYAVRARYGLIWIFFGDPARASEVPMPEIPELEGESPWACVPVDFTWNAHHSMIIDNVSDFTHEFLHRKYKPFSESKLLKLETVGDTVFVEYDTKVGRGKISGLFVDRKGIDTNSMKLAYQYPYQWSNTDDKIKHWCFVTPIDERTTRNFYLFYFDHFVVPFTSLPIPRRVMTPFLKIANEVLVKPLLSQDGFAVEAEQDGYERHWDEPIVELSPAVNAFQALTVRKWEEHLAREQAKREQKELVRLERRRALEASDGAE